MGSKRTCPLRGPGGSEGLAPPPGQPPHSQASHGQHRALTPSGAGTLAGLASETPVLPPGPADSGGVSAGEEESVSFPDPGLGTHFLIPIFDAMSHSPQFLVGEPGALGVCGRALMARPSPIHLPLLDGATTEPCSLPGRPPPLYIQAHLPRVAWVAPCLSFPVTLSRLLLSQNLVCL